MRRDASKSPERENEGKMGQFTNVSLSLSRPCRGVERRRASAPPTWPTFPWQSCEMRWGVAPLLPPRCRAPPRGGFLTTAPLRCVVWTGTAAVYELPLFFFRRPIRATPSSWGTTTIVHAHTCTHGAVALIGSGPGNRTARGNYLWISCDSKRRTQTLVELVVVTQLNLTQLEETKEPVGIVFFLCYSCRSTNWPLSVFLSAPPSSLLIGLCCTPAISCLNDCRSIFKSSNMNRFQMVAIKEAELQPRVRLWRK